MRAWYMPNVFKRYILLHLLFFFVTKFWQRHYIGWLLVTLVYHFFTKKYGKRNNEMINIPP